MNSKERAKPREMEARVEIVRLTRRYAITLALFGLVVELAAAGVMLLSTGSPEASWLERAHEIARLLGSGPIARASCRALARCRLALGTIAEETATCGAATATAAAGDAARLLPENVEKVSEQLRRGGVAAFSVGAMLQARGPPASGRARGVARAAPSRRARAKSQDRS